MTSGRLPFTVAISIAAHTAVLVAAPSLPAAPMTPPRASASLRVDLTSDARGASPARVPPLKKAHAASRRADPIMPSAVVPMPDTPTISRHDASSPSAQPPPTNEPRVTDDAQAGGAVSMAREAPAARYAPAPAYPEEARWEQRTGRVVLSFHIRLDGTVGDAQVLDSSGHADLDHAAIAALHEWKFDAPPPDMLGAWYRYAFRFDLM
jgi:TonB family protein